MAGTAPSELWQIGDWVADASDDSISRDGETIKLEPRTMRLLLRLAEAAGTVVGQDQLLNEVWAGVVVGPASVYQSVSQLRKLLRDTDSPPTYIATISRKGYRLLAPARRLERRPPVHATPAPPFPPASVAPAAPAAPATTEPPLQPLSAPKVRDRRRQRTVVGLGLGLVLLILLALAWAPFKKYLARVPPTPSMVVLPFLDMSADKSQQAFCDGLTEELSSWLAQLPSLRVVARTSAFSFKDKPTDVREIGRRLGTTYVLEGSMRRTGGYMRVSVQLIDALTGYHRWAGAYDAPVIDVIKVQEDIARSIATNLEIRLATLTSEGFAARGSSSAEAYQLYLDAQHHRQLLSRADNDRAIELYQQALAADPGFALANIGLVQAYLNQQYFNGRSIAEISADAAPLLQRVAERHPNLADLYSTRAALELHQMRSDAALRDLKRAIQLNPNSYDALSQLGLLHLVSGQPRFALEDYSNAGKLDPLNDYVHAQRCLALQDLGRFGEAASACETARALAPQGPWGFVATSWLGDAQGRVDEALRWNAGALKRNPGAADLYADRGNWFLALSDPDGARATYREASAAAAGDADALDTLTELSLLSALATGGVPALKTQLSAIHSDEASARTLLDIANAQSMAGDLTAARRLVDRALARTDYGVQVERDAAWVAREGYSYALIAAYIQLKTGDEAAAESRLKQTSALLEQMIQGGVARYGVYQLQAEIAAVRGHADESMRLLTRAADTGWSNTWRAQQEPFLASLRERSDYKALIERVNTRNASMRGRMSEPAASASPAN